MPQVVIGGQDYEIRNITLSSTDDTEVDFNEQVNSVVIRCRTEVDMQFRKTDNNGNYFTIPAGSSLTLDVNVTDKAQGGFIFGFLRAASGTPVAEVIGIF